MVSEIWKVIDILPDVTTNLEPEGWMFYVFAALMFGIIIGGMMRGLAKLVLGIVMLSGFAVVILLLMQKQEKEIYMLNLQILLKKILI